MTLANIPRLPFLSAILFLLISANVFAGYYDTEELQEAVSEITPPTTKLSPEEQSQLNNVLSKRYQKDVQNIDYSDETEMTLSYYLCMPQGFPGSTCRKVEEVCNQRYKMWKKAVRRGWKKPWVCHDFRVISKFIN